MMDNKALWQLQTASPFAYGYFLAHQEAIDAFLARFSLNQMLSDDELKALVAERTLGAGDDEAFAKALRVLRYELMVRWIWQDSLGLISVPKLTAELSCFADEVIKASHHFVYDKLTKRYGEPYYQKGKTLKKDEFAIIAMGKLGAGELNLSSDIDLIFVHLGNGETDGKKVIDTQKFMTNLGRGIIKLIDDTTADGFVFRVDMRLRPWGDGSPLVMTLPALSKYFDEHGRTWERFAWLKARVVNEIGAEFFETLEQLRKNFVFRYYVDYSAFSALREMRMLISNQVAQRQDLDNVKLGVGGIRDIEFIAQSFALIYGGKYPSLIQKTACLEVLDELCHLNLLERSVGDRLSLAYLFLRRLEHAIQARHDTQTQKLPSDDELSQIATTLGFDGVESLKRALSEHRQAVSVPFDSLVMHRETGGEQTVICHEENLAKLDDCLDETSGRYLEEFWQSRAVKTLTDTAKDRLNRAYPAIISAVVSFCQTANVDEIAVLIKRLTALLEAIVKRSIYLVMLSENPKATQDLIAMLSKSAWISDELVAYPVLLDNFLQKRYQHLPSKQELTQILEQSLLSVPAFDDEGFLMSLRIFKKTQVLAVASSDILNHHPIMKVSDSLTFIAEVALLACLNRAFDELTAKHGYPIDLNGKILDRSDCGFAIIGYGKLGGIEMGYASDLDVVFLHRLADNELTVGDAVKPITGMKFATRLVQKLITYLTTQTRDGRVYELDMRLRPSGNAGVMVISVAGFAHYQEDKAWAWEHQALVRARGICGDKAVLAEFDDIRQKILTKARDKEAVKAEVLAMRQKMYDHFVQSYSPKADEFHLKYSYGGLIDIEFMAQFLVLSLSDVYPSLAVWSDNVRIFECVGQAGILDIATCEILTQSYLDLRKSAHLIALDGKRRLVKVDAWQDVRITIQKIWASVFGL